jgi:hypothetical protein
MYPTAIVVVEKRAAAACGFQYVVFVIRLTANNRRHESPFPGNIGKSGLKRGTPSELVSPAPRSYEWLLPVLDCPRPTHPKRSAQKNGGLFSCF